MELLDIIPVVLTSMVKFLFSGLVSYRLGNSFLETVLLTSAGGCAGTLIFYFTSARVLEWFRLRHLRRMAERKAQGLPAKRIFTRTNRLIVRVKRGYGLQGLAVIGPAILSIPIGSVIAAKYFRHDRRTLPALLSSVLIWSVVLSFAWSFTR
ncbi:MAG: hypothetical protein R2815_13335 [Flavobacteriales bacterium]|nr:hypothetical protein [Flavobacteriales bacterium]